MADHEAESDQAQPSFGTEPTLFLVGDTMDVPVWGDVPSLLLILGMMKLGCRQAAATMAKERCSLSRFQPSLFLSLFFLFSHSFHLTCNKLILCTGLRLIQVFAQARARIPVAGDDR